MSARAPEFTPERIADDTPPMIHLYPSELPHRISGMPLPHPGDIARCGHVKNTPADRSLLDMPVDCVVCASLGRRS